MREFFASLRVFLAHIDLEGLNLGVVAHQMIKDEFIPRLQKRLAEAKTDNESERIQSLIAEFEKYSNPKNSESKIYSRTAASVVRTIATRSKVGEDDMEDLMQQLAVDFFQPLHARGRSLMGDMMKFDEMGGPLALNKFWMSVVDFRTKFRIRELQRKYQEKTISRPDGDDSEYSDPISNVTAPTPIDESYIRQVMKDLVSFIHKKLKNPEAAGMFDRWMEVAQTKGPSRVDMKHDVFQYLADQGYEASARTMEGWWPEIKRLIVRFFDTELEGQVSDQVRKMLRVGSVEIIAYEEFRKRLARWMLGGILRGVIEGK